MPELNWSISREGTPPREQSPKKQFRGSQSTSRLPDPQPEVETTRHVTRHVTTSQLPVYQRSNSTDSSSSGDSQTRRRKNFEAFVMTGDRMINLAKTPANVDFQSKYYKPDSNAAVKSLGNKFEVTDSVEVAPTEDFEGIVPLTNNSLPSSPVAEETTSHRRKGDQRQNRRSYVRGSKSEDQLTGAGVECDNSSEEERMLINSSCHTLLDTETMPRLRSVTTAPPHVSSESSSSRSLVSGDHGALTNSGTVTRQASDETSDFSSSSLISCSEHYNGDSLLDPGQLSPVSPSSPDTPEWSLIANGDSFHKDVSRTKDGLITSKDNRVIITINKERLVSPVSSDGTITPSHDMMMSPPPHPSTSPPPSASMSSEEESDMESLHSYHPPVKIVDIPSANRLAKRLYNLEGFRKSDISRHLSKNNDFSKAVAEEYCKLFTFSRQTLDEALRNFLQQFCLTGETQDRERVLLHFSKRFLECNPALRGVTYQSHDAVHTLTCAIMLLNTDLHNEALQQRRMTVDEFVENLAELNDGTNFPDSLLRAVYAAIKSEPIEWVMDESGGEESEPTSTLSQDSGPPPQPHNQPPELSSEVNFSNHQTGGINPFLSMPDPESSVDYKRGYVMRKSCFDANKKKTKMGKRSWKMYYLTLRDLVLYCFKDEKSAQSASSYESPMTAIRIHHSIASIAGDYTKKQFVFRLQTCDRAEYLFQTSDMKELETWVDTINTVVSRYSSPPLPAPCSSSIKFQRPLYPSSRSNQSLSDQVSGHKAQVRELSQQLSHHTANAPDRNAKAAILADFREKREFLEQELERFSVYISVLENLVSKHDNNQILSSPLKIIMN